MREQFTIVGRMPGLNDYTKACNKGWYVGNRMKRRETERAFFSSKAAHLRQFHKPVSIHIDWYEPNHRRDRDNIVFAKKFILDGLVNAHIIQDDNAELVVDTTDEVLYDKDNPRIVVTITDEV